MGCVQAGAGLLGPHALGHLFSGPLGKRGAQGPAPASAPKPQGPGGAGAALGVVRDRSLLPLSSAP